VTRRFTTSDPTPRLGVAIILTGLVLYGIASWLGWGS
jgi:hypothetical protein